MTTDKNARALRRKNKALKDTTRGGNALDKSWRDDFRDVAKLRDDSNKSNTYDAITDYDNS